MTAPASERQPLRLWPGVVAASLLIPVRFVVPFVVPDGFLIAMIGGLVCVLAILLWWLFFSRAPWSERLGAIVLMIVATFATWRLVHVSISNGLMGRMFPVYAVPVLCLALVAGVAAGRRLTTGPRAATLVAAILLGCGAMTLIRTDGIGSAGSQLAWRWSKTPEQRLLAQSAGQPAALAAAPAALPATPPALAPVPAKLPAAPAALPVIPAAPRTAAEWPGFRGPHRDSIIPGIRIETDWTASPPVELWRRPIGPGWSSFAVRGDLIYTQEQRGDDEVVACYNATTGKPVWMHRDVARFWESNAGAGPRATPTLHDGRVYTLGATGILNALDAANGTVAWTRNAASDTGAKLPGWGFTGSPLVVDDLVIVAASGRLAAYDLASGERRWSGPARGGGYSSPHLLTLGGVAQVLLLSGTGAISVAPVDGKLLWEHPAAAGSRIVQPALASDSDLLMSLGNEGMGGAGLGRIAVAHGPGGWTVQERWTSTGLKPDFNDFVIHKGHAYGFDRTILACIDLNDGKRKWKGGRFGAGQLVLLCDQDLLLVLSEEGELALVGAAPDKFAEFARFKAIEGKTWNHPVLAAGVLLVRNSEEMAAFRLSPARR